VEPLLPTWRLMSMRTHLHGAAVLMLLSPMTAGCSSDEQVQASCSMAPTIAFEGREYIAVGSLPGLKRTEVRAGKRLGTGESASCPGQPMQEVQVFKVAGVPVGKAVFVKPNDGLMKRWNRDGSIK
jgi:hypothetical protein